MVTPPDIEAQILRYYHVEKWRVGTIAGQLHVHHSVVTRVLAQAGSPRIGRSARPSQIDAIGVIRQTLATFPTLTASRLYGMVRERGYRGSADHFRQLIAWIGRTRRPRRSALRCLCGSAGGRWTFRPSRIGELQVADRVLQRLEQARRIIRASWTPGWRASCAATSRLGRWHNRYCRATSIVMTRFVANGREMLFSSMGSRIPCTIWHPSCVPQAGNAIAGSTG